MELPPDSLKKRIDAMLPNIFIAQPRRDASQPFLQDLSNTDQVVRPVAAKLTVAVTDGLRVDRARNELVKGAMESNAEFIWFVDDDTVIPFDGLHKLYHAALQGGHPVLSGVVWQKELDPLMAALCCVKDRRFYVPDLSPKDELIEVNWFVGAACLLIQMDVFKKMLNASPKEDFFRLFTNDDGHVLCGEDMYFCHRCSELGIPIKAHRGVQCRHYDIKTMRYWGGDPKATYHLNTK